jgi:hypothetical protein
LCQGKAGRQHGEFDDEQSPSGGDRLVRGCDGLEEPGAVVVARVAGAALLSLALACWLVRAAGASLAGRAVIAALLLYNVGVAAILIHAVFGSGLSGAGTWPAILLHTAVATWCVACLRGRRATA